MHSMRPLSIREAPRPGVWGPHRLVGTREDVKPT